MHSASHLLHQCKDDLQFVKQWIDPDVMERLQLIGDRKRQFPAGDFSRSSLFPCITYREAIDRYAPYLFILRQITPE